MGVTIRYSLSIPDTRFGDQPSLLSVNCILDQSHGLLQIFLVDIVEGADFLAVDIQYGSHITLLVYEGNNNLGTGEG